MGRKYIPLFLVMFLYYSKTNKETDYQYTYLDANSSGRIIAQMVRYKIQQTRLPGTRYTPTLPASYACPVLGMSLACSPHLPDGCKTSRNNIAVFVYSSHIFLIFNYLSVETMIVEKLT